MIMMIMTIIMINMIMFMMKMMIMMRVRDECKWWKREEAISVSIPELLVCIVLGEPSPEKDIFWWEWWWWWLCNTLLKRFVTNVLINPEYKMICYAAMLYILCICGQLISQETIGEVRYWGTDTDRLAWHLSGFPQSILQIYKQKYSSEAEVFFRFISRRYLARLIIIRKGSCVRCSSHSKVIRKTMIWSCNNSLDLLWVIWIWEILGQKSFKCLHHNHNPVIAYFSCLIKPFVKRLHIYLSQCSNCCFVDGRGWRTRRPGRSKTVQLRKENLIVFSFFFYFESSLMPSSDSCCFANSMNTFERKSE